MIAHAETNFCSASRKDRWVDGEPPVEFNCVVWTEQHWHLCLQWLPAVRDSGAFKITQRGNL